MTALAEFREAVREHRRTVGRAQGQLATAIGVNPQVLSRKLNDRDGAVLTAPEVLSIVTTLARWGALGSRADAEALLVAGGVGLHTVPTGAWAEPPLSTLPPATEYPPELRIVAERQPSPNVASLPANRSSLVGRDQERLEAADALRSARLVTLTGVGGIGKTRLALLVANDVTDRFDDGVVFVDLAPVRDPGLLVAAVAAACGLGLGGPRDAEVVLLEALRDRELLLVLDNMEQLVEGVPVLGRLLEAAGRLRILATSRVTLHLYGEHAIRVPPLGLEGEAGTGASEATRLFLDRAQSTGNAHLLDFEAQRVVQEICRALDGLPLAIELAAAQTRFYSPAQLLPMLGTRFGILRDGPRDVPDRQQTLLSALDWSYALLSESGRDLLSALGVLAGRFDLAAAAAVVDVDPDLVLPQLVELVEHSLLEVDPEADLPFVLFETVRAYGLARLAESGEEDRIHRRSLHYHLDLARSVNATEGTAEFAEHEASLERVYPNMRIALEYACRQGPIDPACLNEGLRLATALASMWVHRGLLTEGRRMFERLLAVEPAEGTEGAGDDNDRAVALLRACGVSCFTGDYPAAILLGEECVAVSRRIGDDRTLGRAYRCLGEAHYSLGSYDLAETDFAHGRAASQQAGDLNGVAAIVNMMGQLHRRTGQLDLAAGELREAITLFEHQHEANGRAATMHSLAEVERDLGHLDEATALFTQALETSATILDMRNIAYDLEGLASIAERHDDSRRALYLVAAAQGLRALTGARLPSMERTEVERIVDRAGSRLAPADRAEALAAGRAGELSDVIAEALAPQR